MRVLKPLGEQRDRCERETEDHFFCDNCVFIKAVENADGVPYYLIFGEATGEGHYQEIGPGIKRMMGINPYEFTEKLFLGMIRNVVPISQDIPSDISKSREKFINGEIKCYNAKVLIRVPGGETKWIRDSAVPVRDEATGKVTGAAGIFQEITGNAAEPAGKSDQGSGVKHDTQLEDVFLNNLSHEIRTPLNAIVGFSSLLVQPDVSDEDRREFGDLIIRNTDRLLNIFNDIAEMSNIEAGKVRVKKDIINLDSFCRSLFNKMTATANEKKLKFRFAPSAGNENLTIFTDSYKLLQILSNLLSNALKFTNEGEVECGYELKDNRIEFFVSDTGIGIPQEYHARIFRKFFQVENCKSRCYEGAGLGLSIVRAYVNTLGGDIWFRSQPGHGSVFYFTIPYEKPTGDNRNVRFKLI
jgi:signal transduction histidine kinase